MTNYDPERALVTRIVETRNIKEVIRQKVSSKFIADSDTREVFEWLVERYDEFGKVPSLKLLQTHFPDFEEESTDDDVELVIASLREKTLYADLQGVCKRIAQEAKGDVHEGLATLKKEASNLSVRYSSTETLDLSQSADRIRKKYKLFQKKKGMLGIPWPWARLNTATRGMQKGDYHAFYGDPGTMKTWILIYILHYAHKFHGARPMLITQEMLPESIMLRWSCLRAGIEYSRFQDGDLTPKEFRRFDSELNKLHEDDSFIVEELDSSGAAALTEIQALVQQHNINLLGVDGLGDLPEDSEWGSWKAVNKGLKKMAKRNKLPIVGTAHTNRDKRKKPKKYDATQDDDATDVALGESLLRYTDGLFHMIRTPQHKECNEIAIKTKKVREGKPCAFIINAYPAKDFSQKLAIDDEIGDTPLDDEDTL